MKHCPSQRAAKPGGPFELMIFAGRRFYCAPRHLAQQLADGQVRRSSVPLQQGAGPATATGRHFAVPQRHRRERSFSPGTRHRIVAAMGVASQQVVCIVGKARWSTRTLAGDVRTKPVVLVWFSGFSKPGNRAGVKYLLRRCPGTAACFSELSMNHAA